MLNESKRIATLLKVLDQRIANMFHWREMLVVVVVVEVFRLIWIAKQWSRIQFELLWSRIHLRFSFNIRISISHELKSKINEVSMKKSDLFWCLWHRKWINCWKTPKIEDGELLLSVSFIFICIYFLICTLLRVSRSVWLCAEAFLTNFM